MFKEKKKKNRIIKKKPTVRDIAKKVDQKQFDAMVRELEWRLNGGCGNLLDALRELDDALEQLPPLIKNSALAGVINQWATDSVSAMLREAK